MYIYIIVGILLIFALWKERQALGCPENPLSTTDCDNADGKAIKGTHSTPEDPTNIVVEKIKKAADFGDRWVMWRLCFLLSFPCVVATYFFLHASTSMFSSSETCYKTDSGDLFCMLAKSFPSEKELIIGMFVITALTYFTLNFYKFHLINYARKNIDEGVDILASRIK